MSRFVQPFITAFNPQQVMNFINSYMQREGFEYVTKDGESYWKKGVGLLTAPQFIKITPTNNGYVLEAWLKWALFPGVYVGEMGLSGFVGAVPKAILKDRVDAILMSLQAMVPNQNGMPQINRNQIPPVNNGNIPPQMNMNQRGPVNNNVPPQANMNGNPYQNNF